MVVAGCGATQKKLSEFSKQNNITGMEFLSCIPGSVGGGIRMNSGCFDEEFKDILVSIQCIDFEGNVKLGDKVQIKSNTIIKNAVISSGTEVKPYTIIEDSLVG